MNEYSALAIVHAVNTTKREIVHVYRKVRRAASVRECYLLKKSSVVGIEAL